jgi:putative inorganic carbon (HCO3(-)) transporter
MTVATSSPVDPTIQSAQEGEQQAPARAFFWGFQRYVMVAIACSSFVPVLFRYQEHTVMILIALCLGMCALEKKSPWIRNPLDLPLWLFMIWVLCTVPFATDPGYSFAEWKKFVAQAGVFYWSLLVLDRCRQERLPQQILWALVVGGTALAVYALMAFVQDGGTWRDRFIRAHGYGTDYNWLSTYMVIVLPIAGSLLAIGRFPRARVVPSVALVLTGAAQVFSYTRGGWLGHAAQGVMLTVLIGGRRLALGALGFLAIVGVGLVVASHSGFQTDTVAATTVDTRLAVWTIGLREVAAHPIVGIGYGNNSFIKKFPEYSVERQARLPEQERIIPSMHSTFLMVALGSGLPALFFFVWIFAALLRRLVALPWQAEWNVGGVVLATGIGLAVIGFAVRNLFDYMFMGSLAHLFWLLAAVGITVTGLGWRMARRESTSGDVASLGRIA